MKFLNIKNKKVITERQLRRVTSTSFPKEIKPDMLKGGDYALIEDVPEPEIQEDEVAEPSGYFEVSRHHMQTKWNVRKKTREELVNKIKQLRAANYPPLGDSADIEFKQRQKARMLVGKARKHLEDGDISSCLKDILEALEPVEDAKDHDGQISQVKKEFKFPEEK